MFEPEKWIKYRILSYFDLADIDEVSASIVRYEWSERDCMYDDLIAELSEDLLDGDTVFYVVKLVQNGLSGQLPNFRVYGKGDLEKLILFVAGYETVGMYDEIWLCKTFASVNKYNVAGRVLFAGSNAEVVQQIEQVWHCSPRLIETYNTYFQWPYMRMIRFDWGRYWRCDEAHIPIGYNMSSYRLEMEMKELLKMMESKREKIELFGEYLGSFGATNYSIEYKVADGKLRIIDWDTAVDKRIVNSYKEKI